LITRNIKQLIYLLNKNQSFTYCELTDFYFPNIFQTTDYVLIPSDFFFK